MALRAVPEHPKFADLKRKLGIGKGCTLGYLECIWHFAARFTPAGNIGKYPDSAIEAWVEWPGEPGALISALLDSNWLHRHDDPANRLVIHDWSHHADEIVNTILARHCETFWDGTPPRSGKLNQHERKRFYDWLDKPATSQPRVSQPSDSRVEVPDKTPKPAPAPAPAPALKDTHSPLDKTTGIEANGTANRASARFAYLSDESFKPFVLAAVKLWPDLIEEDLQSAWQFTWKTWDFEQKLDCVRKTQARIDAGEEGRFVTRPPKYLESGNWKRPPRRNGSSAGAESVRSTLPNVRDLMERDRIERGENVKD